MPCFITALTRRPLTLGVLDLIVSTSQAHTCPAPIRKSKALLPCYCSPLGANFQTIMTMYLKDGWFEVKERKALRQEVIDGAMDIAGTLLRVNVSAQLIQTLALKVRTSISIEMSSENAQTGYDQKSRDAIFERLEAYTDQSPELCSFIMDCLEHVHTQTDLLGFYLHLIHISRMLELLSAAQGEVPPTTSETTN